MRSIDENQKQNKRFSFKDLNILLQRTLRYMFVANWKLFSIQLSVFIVLATIMSVHHNHDMIIPNGCIELQIGSVCEQSEEELRNAILIKQNIKYHWGLINYTIDIMAVFLVYFYSIQFKTISNEINNSKL